MNRSLFLCIPLAIVLSGIHAQSAEPTWRVAENIVIDKVPSSFPVGFSLLTHAERQYVAFYNADHQMTVGARTLESDKWQLVTLDSKVGWDSHNGITMSVDSKGHLHLSGNMHCVPLIYFRTDRPGDISSFKRHAMTGQNENRCTYPHFLSDAKGRLVFHYRDGGSGNGRRLYNVYDVESKTWSRLLQTPLFDGQGLRNAYPAGPRKGPDGRFHVHWVWRDTPDCATNHHLSYAVSDDLTHWQTAAGRPIILPITLAMKPVIVDPIPSGGGIINGGAKLVFDSKQRPMIAYHKSDDNGNMQIYVTRFADGKWTRSVITSWDKPVKFSGNGAMPFIGIRVGVPQHRKGNVWSVSYRHRDYGVGIITFSEATLEPTKETLTKLAPEVLPAELTRKELTFPGIRIRHASDLNKSSNPNVRYILKWEVLPPNHDRKPSGPLPPPSTLRLIKLLR